MGITWVECRFKLRVTVSGGNAKNLGPYQTVRCALPLPLQPRPPPVVRTRNFPQDQVCRAPKRIVALIKGNYGVARLKDVVLTRQLWQHTSNSIGVKCIYRLRGCAACPQSCKPFRNEKGMVLHQNTPPPPRMCTNWIGSDADRIVIAICFLSEDIFRAKGAIFRNFDHLARKYTSLPPANHLLTASTRVANA